VYAAREKGEEDEHKHSCCLNVNANRHTRHRAKRCTRHPRRAYSSAAGRRGNTRLSSREEMKMKIKWKPRKLFRSRLTRRVGGIALCSRVYTHRAMCKRRQWYIILFMYVLRTRAHDTRRAHILYICIKRACTREVGNFESGISISPLLRFVLRTFSDPHVVQILNNPLLIRNHFRLLFGSICSVYRIQHVYSRTFAPWCVVRNFL